MNVACLKPRIADTCTRGRFAVQWRHRPHRCGPLENTQSTALLVGKAQEGDGEAREALIAHCLPALRRWARGRLPNFARDLAETEDLVQVTLMQAVRNLDRFQYRGSGSFLAYLRTILLNAVKQELRRVGRTPDSTERVDLAAEVEDSVLANCIGQDTLEHYERGLQELTPGQRDAVVLRLEFGLSFAEVAAETGAHSSDAARMMVSRGLARLAELMP